MDLRSGIKLPPITWKSTKTESNDNLLKTSQTSRTLRSKQEVVWLQSLMIELKEAAAWLQNTEDNDPNQSYCRVQHLAYFPEDL